MTDTNHPFETLVSELQQDPDQGELIQRLMSDYPEELTMEVVTAAMQRSSRTPRIVVRAHISPAGQSWLEVHCAKVVPGVQYAITCPAP